MEKCISSLAITDFNPPAHLLVNRYLARDFKGREDILLTVVHHTTLIVGLYLNLAEDQLPNSWVNHFRLWQSTGDIATPNTLSDRFP